MKYTMSETYAYTCAHHLPTFPDGHKCRGLHGHLCEVTIVVVVERGEQGYAFDHAELDAAARSVLGTLDHSLINEIEGLEDGLAETQLAYIVDMFELELSKMGARLSECHLDEWSSGGSLRTVKHRKSWCSTCPSGQPAAT